MVSLDTVSLVNINSAGAPNKSKVDREVAETKLKYWSKGRELLSDACCSVRIKTIELHWKLIIVKHGTTL